MLRLVHEKYYKHMTKYHITVVIVATLLISGGLLANLVLFFDPVMYSRHTKIVLSLVSLICIVVGLVTIVLIRYVIYKSYKTNKLLVSLDNKYRESLVNNAAHKTFDYHNAQRRSMYLSFIVLIAICIAIVITGEIMLVVFIGLPFTAGFAAKWIKDGRRRSNSIKISAEGLAYKQGNDAGFIPWINIQEITSNRHGYELKTSNITLTIDTDIEPMKDPEATISKGFITNKRYDVELIEQILRMAPHVSNRTGI